jgi:hypothetical protein
MSLTYKARRRLSLLILLVGLPVYAIFSISLIAQFDRPSILFELFVYLGLGVIWALPFKYIFKGVGQADPEEK